MPRERARVAGRSRTRRPANDPAHPSATAVGLRGVPDQAKAPSERRTRRRGAPGRATSDPAWWGPGGPGRLRAGAPAPGERDVADNASRTWARLQRKLAKRVDENEPWRWTGDRHPTIAGVFVALPDQRLNDDIRDIAWAAAVVMEGHTVVATATATRKLVRPTEAGYLRSRSARSSKTSSRLSRRSRTSSSSMLQGAITFGGRLAIQLGAAIDVPTVGVTDHPDVGERLNPARTVAMDPRPDREPPRGVPRPNRVQGQSRHGPCSVADDSRDRPRHVLKGNPGRQRMPEPLQRARALSRRLRSEYERSAGSGNAGRHPWVRDGQTEDRDGVLGP